MYEVLTYKVKGPNKIICEIVKTTSKVLKCRSASKSLNRRAFALCSVNNSEQKHTYVVLIRFFLNNLYRNICINA